MTFQVMQGMGQGMTYQCFQKKNLDLKQLKNTLKIYLGKKLGQMDQSGGL